MKLIYLSTIALVIGFAPFTAEYVAKADTCQEDMPCWDCRYDGNRICGPNNSQGEIAGDYSNPNCWPGAIYCPPVGSLVDETVR